MPIIYHGSRSDLPSEFSNHIWLVVSMIFYDFPFSWEFHHPNWRTPSFFRGVGQPPTRYDRFHFSDDAKASMIPLSHISTYSRNLRHQWGVHQIYIYIYWLKHIKITSIYIYRDDKQLPFSHSFRICSTDFWIVNFGELAAFLCLGGGPGAIPSDASVRNRKKVVGASDGSLETHFFGRSEAFPCKKRITFHGELLHNC